MTLVLGQNEMEYQLAATDSDNNLLTSLERLRSLFEQGYAFEALAGQVVLVEGLCLMYLLARKQADGIVFKEDLDRLMATRKLTFGAIVRNLRESEDGVHDISLRDNLTAYVDYRNALAHQLVGKFSRLDLEAGLNLGEMIAGKMRSYLLFVINRAQQSDNGIG